MNFSVNGNREIRQKLEVMWAPRRIFFLMGAIETCLFANGNGSVEKKRKTDGGGGREER